MPVMDYGATVWGFKYFQAIENVQNRAMRFYLGVHRFASVEAMAGDLGWVPSRYRRWLHMLRY